MLVLTQEPEERIQMGESILELKRRPDGLFVKLKRLGRRRPAGSRWRRKSGVC